MDYTLRTLTPNLHKAKPHTITKKGKTMVMMILGRRHIGIQRYAKHK